MTIPISYNVWITLVVGASADQVIARLVRKRYHVGPLGPLGLDVHQKRTSVLALSLRFQDEERHDVSEVFDDVKSALHEQRVLYFSLVTTCEHNNDARWADGNLPRPPPSTKFARLAKGRDVTE